MSMLAISSQRFFHGHPHRFQLAVPVLSCAKVWTPRMTSASQSHLCIRSRDGLETGQSRHHSVILIFVRAVLLLLVLVGATGQQASTASASSSGTLLVCVGLGNVSWRGIFSSSLEEASDTTTLGAATGWWCSGTFTTHGRTRSLCGSI